MNERVLSRSIAEMAELLEPFVTGSRQITPPLLGSICRCLEQLEIMARILELRAARQTPDPAAITASANIIRFPSRRAASTKGAENGRSHS
jgi:hypothetical protein